MDDLICCIPEYVYFNCAMHLVMLYALGCIYDEVFLFQSYGNLLLRRISPIIKVQTAILHNIGKAEWQGWRLQQAFHQWQSLLVQVHLPPLLPFVTSSSQRSQRYCHSPWVCCHHRHPQSFRRKKIRHDRKFKSLIRCSFNKSCKNEVKSTITHYIIKKSYEENKRIFWSKLILTFQP